MPIIIPEGPIPEVVKIQSSVSPAMVKRANLMSVLPTDFGWRVLTWDKKTPGEHFVGKDYQCDCKGYEFRGMCSHIVAVRISEESCGD